MAHSYAINDDVHHQQQGPQGRAVVKQRSVYTIVGRRRSKAADRLPAEPGRKTQMFGVPSQDRPAPPPLMHRRADGSYAG